MQHPVLGSAITAGDVPAVQAAASLSSGAASLYLEAATARMPGLSSTAIGFGAKCENLGAREFVSAGPTGLADDLLKYVSNVTPKKGFTDVFVHSDGISFLVEHAGSKGGVAQLSHRDLANFMKSKGISGDIRLISCWAGQCELAQNLSNKLGVKVIAADTEVLVPMRYVGKPLPAGQGKWFTFKPKGTR